MPDIAAALIRPPSLRDQIYDRIHAAILSGELAPGAPIVEAELAALVGASRTPVREALRRLEAEGLIEQRGGRGLAVRETDRSEAICIFEIREALETLAARRACRLMRPEQLVKLSDFVQRMHDHVDDAAIFDRAASGFHDYLIDCANGDRLKRMLGEVRSEVRAQSSRALKTRERRVASAQEHGAILDALRSGDERLVAEAMLAHIAHARQAVVEGTTR